ncbi:MAG: hypothetical protein J5861_04695, partial [Desulfovibrio sp.]|nr:hypothetical protein [Desulfovibrio sp.]
MDAEKRKKKSSRGRKAETQELCNGETVARAAPAVKQKTGIHMAVIIFGMILALVVGIFLGTFITQWRESISRNPMPTGEALTQPSAPTAPAPVSSPAVKVAESETATRGEAQVVSSGLSASAHAGQDPRIVELEEAVLKN